MASGPILAARCLVCDRNRHQVSALVELRPGRVVCAECVAEAVELLVEHYGDVSPFMPPSERPQVPA